jgi:hypothetical protein
MFSEEQLEQLRSFPDIGMSPSEGGKQQVDALIVHPADLRERERLDTRDVYLNQGCFRSSQD